MLQISFCEHCFCVCDFSYLVEELKEVALPFLQILLQHICYQVSPPARAQQLNMFVMFV